MPHANPTNAGKSEATAPPVPHLCRAAWGREFKFALAPLLILASAASTAGTVTATFNVTATVVNACGIDITDMAFGDYNPTSPAPQTSSSSVSVRCTRLTPYDVRLNKGIHGSDVTDRKMKGPGANDVLNYTLYRDPAYTQNWGDTNGIDTLEGVGTGLTENHTVYGRIPAEQNANSGPYSDVITVTVSF
jgi:spore coat protein U-like protein